MRNPTKCVGWFVVWLALAALGGCRRAATVTGKVVYWGHPVTYGSVIFVSKDKTARFGVIGPDGVYTLEGVPPGDVEVAVISRNPAEGLHVPRARPKKPGNAPDRAAAAKWFRLPAKFENAATSGLRCTVTAGRNRHDIELK